jgi:hypothetical protein
MQEWEDARRRVPVKDVIGKALNGRLSGALVMGVLAGAGEGRDFWRAA